jgi:hypothetical protein
MGRRIAKMKICTALCFLRHVIAETNLQGATLMGEEAGFLAVTTILVI